MMEKEGEKAVGGESRGVSKEAKTKRERERSRQRQMDRVKRGKGEREMTASDRTL